jgi:5-formyltetrahydrofolate cyclo-ligase
MKKMNFDKKTMRQYLSNKRISIASKNILPKSIHLVNNLFKLINSVCCDKIFLFHPINNEPNCLLLLDKLQSGEVALPVVEKNNNMNFFSWQKGSPLRENKYKIKEPCNTPNSVIYPDTKTLICVPALAVDVKGYRIGYGGGFYDRYMIKYPNAIYVALVFSDFIYDELPSDTWDQSVDYLCTDDQVITII